MGVEQRDIRLDGGEINKKEKIEKEREIILKGEGKMMKDERKKIQI